MLPWRRPHLSFLSSSRFSPACTGSVAVAAMPVHVTLYSGRVGKHKGGTSHTKKTSTRRLNFMTPQFIINQMQHFFKCWGQTFRQYQPAGVGRRESELTSALTAAAVDEEELDGSARSCRASSPTPRAGAAQDAPHGETRRV